MNHLVAYFTMEIALDSAMPTYAGGLGVLAGDTVRSAAELKVPMVAVTLLHRKGYFCQKLDASGWQHEESCDWDINHFLVEQTPRVTVTIEGRTVHLRAWKYEVKSSGGFSVPVFFLDTDLPENSDQDRTLTHFLYGGDAYYRICQEVGSGPRWRARRRCGSRVPGRRLQAPRVDTFPAWWVTIRKWAKSRIIRIRA